LYSVGLDKQFPPIELSELFPTDTKDAVDSLKKMLEINPEKRITIEEALSHRNLLDEDEKEILTLGIFSYDFEDNLK
jgi:serine/threonine protein kinase